jgi:hypothetical protein
MAADTIIIKYRADTSKFSQDTKALTGDLVKVGIAGDNAGDKTTASFNKAAQAINKTDKQTKQTTGAFNGMASSLTGIAASLGVAFGVQQIIQFGKASAEAFIDAEKNAQLLLFALKGNEAAQGRLMAQASELQNTTIFDDDTIQQAQTFLANQGRTEEQIKKVIDAAVELSTVTGVDLNTAVMQLDATFEGNIGKMGKLDSAFKGLTKEQLANGAAADLLIEKYGGTAVAMGETTAGQVAKLKNRFGELQETIGGQLVPLLNGFWESAQGLGRGDVLTFLENTFAGQVVTGIRDMITGVDDLTESMTDYEKSVIKVSLATDEEITAQFEALGGATNATAMEFKKFADEMRQGVLVQTFEDLSKVLEINKQQFKQLTDLTDKYGVSVRVTADAILELKNASDEDLETTFLNAKKFLNVTREDWDKYIGKIKEVKPLHDDIAKSTEAVVGPYDKLNNRISALNKIMLDNIVLGKDYTKQEMEIIDLIKQRDEANQKLNASITSTNALMRENNQIVLLNTEETNINYEAIKKQNDIKLAGILATMQQTDANANFIKQMERDAEIYGELSQLAGTFNDALTNIFGDAAKNSAVFLEFQKAIAIAEIALSSAQAIASGIAAIAKGDPISIISGITSITAGIGNAIGGLIQQVNALQTPTPPQFFDGTDYLQLNGNPKGKDTIPVMAHEGEAIIPTDKNLSEPGLANAWINGNLDKYVIDKWVSPALMNQEREHKKEFAENIAASMLLQSGSSFDDYRLYRLGLDQVNLLSQNNKLLGKVMQTKNPWAV